MEPLVGNTATTVARKIATLYTRGCGKVVLGSKGPSTDGTTIWLPDVMDPASELEARRLLVSNTHEIGHCKYSTKLFEITSARMAYDPDAPWRMAYGVPAEHNKLFHACVNVAEDVRIERLMHVEYPGLLADYHDDYSRLAEVELPGRLRSAACPVTKKLLDLLFLKAAEVEYLEHSLAPLPIPKLPRSLEPLWKALAHLVPDMAATKSAAEAEAMGNKVYKKLLELASPPPEPPEEPTPSPEGSKGSKGKEGSASDSSSGTGEGCCPQEESGTPPEPPAAEGTPSAGEDDEGEAPKPSTGEESPEPPGTPAPESTSVVKPKGKPKESALSPSELLKDVSSLSEDRRVKIAKDARVSYSVAEGVVDEWYRTHNSASNEIQGKEAIAEGLRMLGGTAPRLRALFLSEHSMVIRGGMVKGKHLDTGRISRLETTPPWQKPRIWESRTPGAAVDAAVTLLLDESASMRGNRIKLASRIGAGLAITLERARIPFELIGYSTRGSSSLRAQRSNPALYNVIKTFEEPRVAHFRLAPHVGDENSDPDALRVMGERLLARREPKKVLLFLSDGAPCNGEVTAAATMAFRRELEILQKRGVLVFGFGMEADLRMYFSNPNQHITVTTENLAEMPRLMLKKLESILL
jgi:cobaltochelatase CobT